MLVTLAAMLGRLVHRAAGLVSLIITQTVATDACWRRAAGNVCGDCRTGQEAADDGGMTAIPVARIVDALKILAANISITVKNKRIRISNDLVGGWR